ncbi:MAG: aminomethyl-transferring glycine dehydrogenase subunit GcvPA [Actinobacteria bacterium]|nr:aminomethyl-transferring glycine dehydrogenase subunit GcvPA [Actinomycetota bacterium]
MMSEKNLPTPHPFMANSAAGSYKEMLRVAEVGDIEELFEQIPSEHRYKGEWNFPRSLASEAELFKHMNSILKKSISSEDNLNFLGAGCWQHYVPAICDEMVTRTEFLTPVWGTPSSDHGRTQVWFEFQSQIGELVGMDFVGLPLYSFGTAAGHAVRMAARINGRSEVLVPSTLDPERLKVLKTYCGFPELSGYVSIVMVATDPHDGGIDVADLKSKISERTSSIYFENPTYLGSIEARAHEISAIAHGVGAEVIVGVDPISLGVIAPPSDYAADIVVGTTQPLGVHMNAGGGVGGFIATRDEAKYAKEYPTLQVSLTGTTHPGELAFGLTLFHQSSYGSRENGKDWTGNSVYLWAVANATYMSLMGPLGFKEIGDTIIQRSHYAAALIDEIPGVSVKWKQGFFKEFVVDFSKSKLTVEQINKKLLEHSIFGGKDLSVDFPSLGQSALYCITEIHTVEDIHTLVAALKKVVA